jgi:hypothetical protein
MSDPYTIVLWCADTVRFASLAAAHLLHEGVLAANMGRVDDEIPVAIGVANARRTPVFSRTVSKLGLIRPLMPQVDTPERVDYYFTLTSGDRVDTNGAPAEARDARVIRARDLVSALEANSARALSKHEALALFASVSREPHHASCERHEMHDAATGEQVDVHDIADCCQRVVVALAR